MESAARVTTSQPTKARNPRKRSARAGQSWATALRGEIGRAAPSPPRSEQAEQLEQSDDPRPEPEPAAIGAERRGQWDVAAAATGEQIDSCCQEGQQTGDQHELDRPAANRAASRGTGSSRCPGRTRGPRRACRASPAPRVRPEPSRPARQPLRGVGDRLGWIVAGSRQRDRSDAAATGTAPARRARTGSRGRRAAGARSRAPATVPSARTRVRRSSAGRFRTAARGVSPLNSTANGSRAADRVEVDHAGDVVRAAANALANHAAPIPPNAPPSVETKRIVWFGRSRAWAAPAGAPYARASWISMRRAGRVVVRALAATVVVAVRHHDDRPLASGRPPRRRCSASERARGRG